MLFGLFVFHFIFATLCFANRSSIDFGADERYEPTWESLDSRPIPKWYNNAKLGIFCHWGVYSVPAFRSEWIWYYWKGPHPDKAVEEYIEKNFKLGTSYADFATSFTAEFFDADVFREIVEASGARYFVITSKHHEGFTLWPSKTSWNWNSVDLGPHKDIVGELKNAFSKSDVHFGTYFSQFEWFNRYFLEDSTNNTTDYVEKVSYPQMLELVKQYQPELIWSDGDWGMSDTYWKSKEFLAWLYNDSPVKETVVVNDRWGAGDLGLHGGFLTYSDHYDPGHLLPRKWENCMTLDKNSWGYRRNMRSEDIRTLQEIIEQLVRTIACNGNLLINVGPDNHGIIPPIFEDRLRELGKWVKRNEEAIFGAHPWMYQKDTGNIWYTVSVPQSYKVKAGWTPHFTGSKLYAFVLDFPTEKELTLTSVLYTNETKAAVLLGNGEVRDLKVRGIDKKPLVISLANQQRLAVISPIVIRIENFGAHYRDPIRYLKKRGVLSIDGYPVHKNGHHHRKHRKERIIDFLEPLLNQID